MKLAVAATRSENRRRFRSHPDAAPCDSRGCAGYAHEQAPMMGARLKLILNHIFGQNPKWLNHIETGAISQASRRADFAASKRRPRRDTIDLSFSEGDLRGNDQGC